MTNTLLKSSMVALGFTSILSLPVSAAQVYVTDLVAQGSGCFGFDCVSSESFGSDTLRLKENNLRIHFDDTSSSASFPGNDWRIKVNDTSNGGASYFAIEDSTNGTVPFSIDAGASANTLIVDSSKRIGINTSTPAVTVHAAHGDSPALRLEQNGSSGFTPQTWDMAGNETNFFIRDVTNGSKLPFRIKPGAPDDAIFIAADGDIGLGTDSPTAAVHIRGTAGDSKIYVEETSSTKATRDLLHLKNKGNPQIVLENTNNDKRWAIGAGTNLIFNSPTSSGNSLSSVIMQLAALGGLTLNSTETATSSGRDILTVSNYGNPQIAFMNTNNNAEWRIGGGTNLVVKNTAGSTVMTLTNTGNLTITGSLTTAGSSCGGGCDTTFTNPKAVTSITDHASKMWQNSYLPAVGPTKENAPINVSEKVGGILHELEVAHIYIDQLNKRLTLREAQLDELLKRVEKLEANAAKH